MLRLIFLDTYSTFEICVIAKIRSNNSNTTRYLLPFVFSQLNPLKGTTKAPSVAFLRLDTQRDNKTVFLTSQGMTSTTIWKYSYILILREDI